MLRLKEALKDNNITGKDLAKKVGVTENAISMIINSKRQPRFELLLQIAEVLDVDVKDLFNSTKQTKIETETLYVNRDGKFESIGELRIK